MRNSEGPRVSSRSVRVPLSVGLASAACFLAAAPAPGLGATQSLQVQAAPGATATRPETITATGQVGVPSTITIYAEFGGGSCAGMASVEATHGATLVKQQTLAAGPVSVSGTFTPPTPGTYSICTYLDGAAPGMIEHQNLSSLLSVAPAPSPPSAVPPVTPPVTTPGPTAGCLVPALKRHTLGRAEHLLALGGCKLGRVYRPSAKSQRAARQRAGGRTPTLVVVSQTPIAGTKWIAGYTVAVRLGYRPPSRTSTTKS